MTTPLEAALAYAKNRVPVFPCRSSGIGRKRPKTPRGFLDATYDPAIIGGWWEAWPDSLIGAPTGPLLGAVVLDIDVKDPRANGLDTLEDLGHSVLPETPMVHTATGGIARWKRDPAAFIEEGFARSRDGRALCAERMLAVREQHAADPVEKAEKRIRKQVAETIAAIRKADPRLSEAGAFLKLAESREHAEIWAMFRKLGDGPRFPWVGPNANVAPAGRWPIEVQPLAPQPVRDISEGPGLEALVEAHKKANPALSHAQAYSRVMATPAGAAAYKREKDQRLVAAVGAYRQVAVA